MAPLTPALSGALEHLDDPKAGRFAYYADGLATRGRPLLLIHSINAAACAYEVKPIHDAYAVRRPVYSIDLPGYGFADRSERPYVPRLMTDAIHALTRHVAARHGGAPVDALALSLSAEFLARAAVEAPEAYRSVALVSPTGFSGLARRYGPPGSTRAMPGALRVLNGAFGRGVFALLTTRASIRYFLRRTFGGARIDEGLLDYDHLTTHQPGAQRAPLHFLSGFMFSNDVARLYDALEMPVWMSHGVRGDFVDYRQKDAYVERPNWSFDVFETGALPQFEIPGEFVARYDAFLARVARAAGA